ncbi:hypothetical protein Sango_2483300 [Sesamum angolense]|uniref:Retrotransposon gag protein n=1 Tax=Sesamum angolense TaxID=2727404 RepID=A0AAE1W3L9_9LAMI|nr:hypothetical protein Sango_2483300 [Sesamum angolense]
MPMGYQPPKFQQFDGKGNPKQHVAHFVETCNNAGTYGDHLVKQFVRSLKCNAFDWYTNLEAGSIDGWEQLEQEFLNCFYSTRRMLRRRAGASQKQGKTRSEERGQALFKSSKQRINGSEHFTIQAQKHCKRQCCPKNNVPYERPQKKLTLKEMQAREYPFLDSDVPGIFDDLLEANLIDLP